MEDEDEEKPPHLATGLLQAYLVIMDSRDTLTIEDIEQMLKKLQLLKPAQGAQPRLW